MSSLPDRAETLLRTLIERYILEGQPVGSRSLAKHSGLDVSPATIRNVMADLEDMGLVRAPHTSAGRVPTQEGYRLFVDTLLQVQPLDTGAVNRLQGELARNENPQKLLVAASSLLSQVSRLAAVVSVPRRSEQSGFRQIEFVTLSSSRVLVILVTADGQVQNRVINTDRTYSPSELEQAANYFNRAYSGRSLVEVKAALMAEMQQDSEAMQQQVQLAMKMAQRLFEDEDDNDDLVVSGESNLMEIPELGDIHTLRALFEAFNTKRDLLHLLEHSARSPGVKIFIGRESGYEVLEDCSVITAPYQMGDGVMGTLGVVGPTRMPYERVIPLVDITAKLLSGALSLNDR